MVALTCEPDRMCVNDRRCNIAPIRLTHQQSWPWTAARRVVMIGDQPGSIAQPALHSALKPDPISAIDKRHRLGPVPRLKVIHRDENVREPARRFVCPTPAVLGGGRRWIAHDAAGRNVSCEPCKVRR